MVFVVIMAVMVVDNMKILVVIVLLVMNKMTMTGIWLAVVALSKGDSGDCRLSAHMMAFVIAVVRHGRGSYGGNDSPSCSGYNDGRCFRNDESNSANLLAGVPEWIVYVLRFMVRW